MRKGGWVMLAGALAFVGFVFYSLVSVEPVKVLRSRLEHDGNRVCVAGPGSQHRGSRPRYRSRSTLLRPQWTAPRTGHAEA